MRPCGLRTLSAFIVLVRRSLPICLILLGLYLRGNSPGSRRMVGRRWKAPVFS